jgi:hypothetical protein
VDADNERGPANSWKGRRRARAASGAGQTIAIAEASAESPAQATTTHCPGRTIAASCVARANATQIAYERSRRSRKADATTSDTGTARATVPQPSLRPWLANAISVWSMAASATSAPAR